MPTMLVARGARGAFYSKRRPHVTSGPGDGVRKLRAQPLQGPQTLRGRDPHPGPVSAVNEHNNNGLIPIPAAARCLQ